MSHIKVDKVDVYMLTFQFVFFAESMYFHPKKGLVTITGVSVSK